MPRMLATRTSEESVNERRDGRTLGEHQQGADCDEGDDDGSKPELLVLPHELPQLIYDLRLRHEFILATKGTKIKLAKKSTKRSDELKRKKSSEELKEQFVFFVPFVATLLIPVVLFVARTFSRSGVGFFVDRDRAAKTNLGGLSGVAVDPSPSRASPTRSASAPERKRSQERFV